MWHYITCQTTELSSFNLTKWQMEQLGTNTSSLCLSQNHVLSQRNQKPEVNKNCSQGINKVSIELSITRKNNKTAALQSFSFPLLAYLNECRSFLVGVCIFYPSLWVFFPPTLQKLSCLGQLENLNCLKLWMWQWMAGDLSRVSSAFTLCDQLKQPLWYWYWYDVWTASHSYFTSHRNVHLLDF